MYVRVDRAGTIAHSLACSRAATCHFTKATRPCEQYTHYYVSTSANFPTVFNHSFTVITPYFDHSFTVFLISGSRKRMVKVRCDNGKRTVKKQSALSLKRVCIHSHSRWSPVERCLSWSVVSLVSVASHNPSSPVERCLSQSVVSLVSVERCLSQSIVTCGATRDHTLKPQAYV